MIIFFSQIIILIDFLKIDVRFGHSLIPKHFEKINPRAIRQGKNRAVTARLNLADIFNKVSEMSIN